MSMLAMTIQELTLSASQGAAAPARVRLDQDTPRQSFRRALNDERQRVDVAAKDDSGPGNQVREQDESAESTLRQESQTSQPDAPAPSGEKKDAESSEADSQPNDARSEAGSGAETAAQGVHIVAQASQHSAQNMHGREAAAAQQAERIPQSVHFDAAPNSEHQGDHRIEVVSRDATQTKTADQSTTVPANASGPTSGSGAEASRQASVQPAAAEVLQHNVGREEGKRSAQHLSRPSADAEARNAAPDSSANVLRSGGRSEAPSGSDAMAQLRQLVNRAGADRGSTKPEEPRMTPAGARTMQLEGSIKVENLTGQQASVELQAAARPASSSTFGNHQLHGLGARPDGGEILSPLRSSPDDSLSSDRIVRGLSAMVNQRGGVMNMKLHPAELGSLRVQMSIVQGAVTAQFTASSVEAHMMLDRSIGTLRTALESHGLQVERISVTHTATDSSGTSARQDGHDQQNQHSAGRDHDAGGGESRGRHDGRRSGAHNPTHPEFAGFEEQFRIPEGDPDSPTSAATGGDT